MHISAARPSLGDKSALTDGATLCKVYWQVEQQDLAQVVPHTAALAHSSHNLQDRTAQESTTHSL
jgi:hypothetical protein